MKQIIINISALGEVEIKAVGFKGSSCEAATKAMEEALGTTTKRTKIPDYYQQTIQQQTIGGK